MIAVNIILMLVVAGATGFISFLMFHGESAYISSVTAPLIAALLVIISILIILGIKVEERGGLRIIISILCIGVVCCWLSLFSIQLGLAILIGTLAIVGLIFTYENELRKMLFWLIPTMVTAFAVVLLFINMMYALYPPIPPKLELVEYQAVLDRYDNNSKEFLLTEAWVVVLQNREWYDETADEWHNEPIPITIESITVEDGHLTSNVQKFTGGQLEPVALPLTLVPGEKYVFTVTRNMQGERGGFLISKCEFYPSELSYEWSQDTGDERYESSSLMVDVCYAEKAMVEVNLPKGSFYSANEEYSIVNYGSIDIATWEISPVFLVRGIGFIFVDPPFHQWRWLFEPFIGVSSFGEAIPIALKVSAPVFGGIMLFFFRNAVIKGIKRCFRGKGTKKKRDLAEDAHDEENDDGS